jgi:hypothetical protein
LFIRGEKIQLVDLGDAIREKLLGKIELTPSNDIFFDIPTDLLGDFDTLGLALGFDL